jgi:ABC-type multidrug transport system ATPase subunit
MVAIEIHGLSKRFGDVAAVDDLSFSARAGAVTGFLGHNGAGGRSGLMSKATSFNDSTSMVNDHVSSCFRYAELSG